MFGRPTRSYAHVEHDADGMSSVAAAPYSLRKEGTFKTYRAPLSEHSRRLDPGHIPHALQSRHARKQAAQEGARAELDQILESGYRPSSRSVHNGAADDQYSYREGPESAGMSRHRTAGGLQAESSRMARLRSTASIGSFRGANGSSSGQTRENGEGPGVGGGGSKKGVFVDADGRTHDQEYDPFARHAAESRKKSMSSRRRSAFGSTSAHGHSTAGHGNGHGNGNGLGQDGDTGSETNSSDSGNSDGGMSGRYSAGAPISQGLGGPVPPRKSIDASSIRGNGAADREEEEIRRRLAVERRRLEGLSGYNALAKRRSIISERDRAGGHGAGSIRTMTDEAERMTLNSNYTTGTQYGAAGGAAGRRSQGEYNPSPLSPTFSAASAHGGRARTNTTSDGGDETPVKSTENTLMPPMSPPQPPSPDLSAYGSAKGSMMDHRGPASAAAEVHVPPPSASHRGSDAHIHRDPHSAKATQARAQTQPPKAKVEIKRDGSRKVTGFDAPRSPMPPPPVPTAAPPGQQQLDVPPSAKSAVSRGSRGSSDINVRDGDESVYSAGTNMGNGNGLSSAASTSARYRREREKPAPRPREEIFPETPAQAKRREEKERRAALRSGPSSASAVGGGTGSRAGSVTGGARVASSTIIRSSPHTQAPTAAQSYASTNIHSRHHNGNATASQLAIDTSLAASTRLLPEIQIVEDDDPRIVFPSQGGRSTRVQTVHDHVIRGPFSHALNAQGLGAAAASGGSGAGYGYAAGGAGERSGMSSLRAGSRAGSPGPSAPFNVNGGGNGNANKPSSINSPFSVGSGTGTVEDRIGYLPSRWANGDKQLRMTEEEREMYRPKEWGGRNGELGGRPDEWHPELKDQIKRSWKDVQTNARFSLFRAKKKLGRM